MKRFHVHIHVDDLERNIAFYSALFGATPARVETDYAKWMLEDPPVNFAVSTRGQGHQGLDHFGIQVDQADDLAAMKAQAQAADLALVDEGATTCCYARSDKHWVIDPQGLPWEHFHTLGSIPTFREAAVDAPADGASACCTPTAGAAQPVATVAVPLPMPTRRSNCC